MTIAATAFSKLSNSLKAAENASRAVLEKLGTPRADAVLFFATTDHKRSYGEILKKIREMTGAREIAGASASGVLTEEAEIQYQPGLALMAFNETADFKVSSFLARSLQENNFQAGETLGRSFRASGIQPQSLLLLPDAFSFQSHAFFDGFENACGYVPMTGGASSENGRENKTYQMQGEEITYDAAAGMAFSGNFRSDAGITRTCQPFGEPLRITRAEGNLIYEMDGRPAYDLLLESLSRIEFESPEHLLQRVFLGLPMRNYQTEFSNNYFIRNIMSVNVKKGMLTCISPVEEGEFVTFTVRDPLLAERDMRSTLEDLQLRTLDTRPAFGFYFNCCARGEALYGEPDKDTSLIQEYFPKLPAIGFFGYGELAPVDHVNHLHHHTGVLNLISFQ